MEHRLCIIAKKKVGENETKEDRVFPRLLPSISNTLIEFGWIGDQ